ncbi:Fic/DOC family protein [Agromyces sp. GXQ0307]|uniref:Fic/DOC family protein n=1 Tax=Agromyces sp. GXQ0307 TaxID=3377835 RepID=UPI003839E684
MTSDDRPWETGATEDERWEGYLIPGTHILRNLSPRPLQSVAALRAFEDSHVRSRLIELRMEPIEGNYDTEHWRAIHRHLFQDVYAWAGDLRTVNISKGKFFVAPEHIRGAVDDMARALAEENHLKQLSPLRFADRLTDYYHYLNTVHPGREGNGRTQRAFWDELARNAGHRIDWRSGMFQERNDAASLEARVNDNIEPLREMMRECVVSTPQWAARQQAIAAARLAAADSTGRASGAGTPQAGAQNPHLTSQYRGPQDPGRGY